MNYKYVLYQTDESFDYGDFPGACCSRITPTGFTVDIDRYDNVDIESLEGFGDLQGFEKEIKTHKQLYNFIVQHKNQVQDYDPHIFKKFKNIECFEELQEILQANIYPIQMAFYKNLRAGAGEFGYYFNDKNSILIYKARGEYFIDIFRRGQYITPSYTKISKEKYLAKLHRFTKLVKMKG